MIEISSCMTPTRFGGSSRESVLVRTADKNPLHFLQLLTLALGGHLHSSLEIVTTGLFRPSVARFEK
jgi:hypothetical protein